MELACFLHVDGPAGQHEQLQSWADEVCGPALNQACKNSTIEAFSPLSVADPYLGDETGKLLIIQAGFASADDMQSALLHPAVEAAIQSMPRQQDSRLTVEAFTTLPQPLRDGTTPARTASVSFVVRYYRPIEREQEFTDYYIGHHPPIMTRFPRIRNIYCYLPVALPEAFAVARSGCFLGNEIVFDSNEDLNAALNSDARHELREDYKHFLPHQGEVTHHAMLRRVLFTAQGT